MPYGFYDNTEADLPSEPTITEPSYMDKVRDAQMLDAQNISNAVPRRPEDPEKGTLQKIREATDITNLLPVPGPQSGSAFWDTVGSLPMAAQGLRPGGVRLTPVLQINGRFTRPLPRTWHDMYEHPAIDHFGPVNFGSQVALPGVLNDSDIDTGPVYKSINLRPLGDAMRRALGLDEPKGVLADSFTDFSAREPNASKSLGGPSSKGAPDPKYTQGLPNSTPSDNIEDHRKNVLSLKDHVMGVLNKDLLLREIMKAKSPIETIKNIINEKVTPDDFKRLVTPIATGMDAAMGGNDMQESIPAFTRMQEMSFEGGHNPRP